MYAQDGKVLWFLRKNDLTAADFSDGIPSLLCSGYTVDDLLEFFVRNVFTLHDYFIVNGDRRSCRSSRRGIPGGLVFITRFRDNINIDVIAALQPGDDISEMHSGLTGWFIKIKTELHLYAPFCSGGNKND